MKSFINVLYNAEKSCIWEEVSQLYCRNCFQKHETLQVYPHGRDTPVVAGVGTSRLKQRQADERDGGRDGQRADEAHEEADKAWEAHHDLEEGTHHDGALQLRQTIHIGSQDYFLNSSSSLSWSKAISKISVLFPLAISVNCSHWLNVIANDSQFDTFIKLQMQVISLVGHRLNHHCVTLFSDR